MNAIQFERARAIIEHRGMGRSPRWTKRAMGHLIREAGAEVVSTGKRIVAYHMADGQTVCHKRRFKCEASALDTLRQIAAEGEPRKQPIRAYPCYQCLGWHVTSQSK